MDAVLSSAGLSEPGKPPIMVGAEFYRKTKEQLSLFDILNDVKQIDVRDYYAPIVGEFEHFVLLALVRLGNGAYGASIRREVRERTGRDASVGTVYMTLGRLEKKKMIVSYIGNPSAQRGGRRRKHYLIDTEGQKALGRAWRAFTAMAEGMEPELARL